jgi:lactate permease
MNWTQVIDPLHNVYLSALVAVLPILFIFWALVIRKMKGHQASFLAMLLALLIAVTVYRMPVQMALLSTVQGALYGLFPICWIVVSILFLFNLIVRSGQLGIIRHSMAAITSDQRLHALLIAFSFGSFLEGTAGFGAPVAISAAMLAGLGFEPMYAAGICLIANTAPVAFGAIGIPITVASQVTGIPEMVLSQMVGRTLPLLSFILPFYLIVIMSGFRKSLEVLPAILVSGTSFAFLQWLCSNYSGPYLPDIVAGGGSILCLVLFLKCWQPKKIWRFHGQAGPEPETKKVYSAMQIFRAWSPFIILTVMIILWAMQPVARFLNRATLLIPVAGLDKRITDFNGSLLPHVFKLNILSAAGTAIFISALLAVPLTGLRMREGVKIFTGTLQQLKWPIFTVSAILGFAYIVNDSGIAISIAHVLARSGFLYPFFAPVLGWLGVFITGSDTSSNALFSKLQYATATSVGINPVVTVAANSTGGVVGKMISPQSIAVATASVGLTGRESSLFRFTLKHSLIILCMICLLTFAQAYYIKWIVPPYPAPSYGNKMHYPADSADHLKIKTYHHESSKKIGHKETDGLLSRPHRAGHVS